MYNLYKYDSFLHVALNHEKKVLFHFVQIKGGWGVPEAVNDEEKNLKED